MTDSQSEVKESLIVDEYAHYRVAATTRSEVPALNDPEEAEGGTIAPSKLLTAYEKENGGVRGLNKRTQFLNTTYIGEVPLGSTSPWDRSQDADMFSGGGHSSSSESKDAGSGDEQKSGGSGGFVIQSYPIPERDMRPLGESNTNESKESKEGADHEAKGGGGSKDNHEGKSSTEMKSEGKSSSSRYDDDYTPSREYK